VLTPSSLTGQTFAAHPVACVVSFENIKFVEELDYPRRVRELRDNADVGPSPWVVRFADLIAAGGDVLDIACGTGRHTRVFLERGHRVVAIDRDLSGVSDLAGHPGLEILEADLENGSPLPFAGRGFAGVVVTNFLHRPLMADMVAAVESDGLFIYETYAAGNERFGRPKNPAFLLRPGELLEAVRGRLRVVAYEDLLIEEPRRAAFQRICAVGPHRSVPFHT
jgi:SAM-dependent methyltransferase